MDLVFLGSSFSLLCISGAGLFMTELCAWAFMQSCTVVVWMFLSAILYSCAWSGSSGSKDLIWDVCCSF